MVKRSRYLVLTVLLLLVGSVFSGAQPSQTFQDVIITGKLTVRGLLELAGLAPPRMEQATPTPGGSLAPGSYTYRVSAFNAVGETTGARVDVQVEAPNNAVELSWQAVEGAEGYRIYRFTREGGGRIGEVPGSETSFTDTGLDADPDRQPPETNTSGGNTRLGGDLTVAGLAFLENNVQIGRSGAPVLLNVFGGVEVAGDAAISRSLQIGGRSGIFRPLQLFALGTGQPAGVRFDSRQLPQGRIWDLVGGQNFTLMDMSFGPNPGQSLTGQERITVSSAGDVRFTLGDPSRPQPQAGSFTIAELAANGSRFVLDQSGLRILARGAAPAPFSAALLLDSSSIPLPGQPGQSGSVWEISADTGNFFGGLKIMNRTQGGLAMLIDPDGNVSFGTPSLIGAPGPGRVAIGCSLAVGLQIDPPENCGDVDVGRDLAVSGAGQFQGNLNVEGDAAVRGDALISDNVLLDSTGIFLQRGGIESTSPQEPLRLFSRHGQVLLGKGDRTNDLIVSGSLSVAGLAEFRQDAQVNGSLTVAQRFMVNPAARHLIVDEQGRMGLGIDPDPDARLTVEGNAFFRNRLAVLQDAVIQDNLSVGKDATIEGGLRIDGTVSGLTPDVGLLVSAGGAQLLRWLTVGDPTVAAPHAAGRGDILASGRIKGATVQGDQLCIGTDCRTQWPQPGEFDRTVTDPLYVNVEGDAMSGTLDMDGNALVKVGVIDFQLPSGQWRMGQVQNSNDIGIGFGPPDFTVRFQVSPEGDILAQGAAEVREDLTVGGLLTTQDLQVNGRFSLSDLTLEGDLTVNGISRLEELEVFGRTTLDNLKARDAEFDNVTVNRDLRVEGVKFFVEEHPTDPGKEIAFISQEGPEAGVYVRGEAQLQDGEAVIELPEAFRLVASEQGLTVNLTPVGEWLRLYVVEVSPGRLVVREAQGKSGRFFYRVEGIRKGYEDFEPIRVKEED